MTRRIFNAITSNTQCMIHQNVHKRVKLQTIDASRSLIALFLNCFAQSLCWSCVSEQPRFDIFVIISVSIFCNYIVVATAK